MVPVWVVHRWVMLQAWGFSGWPWGWSRRRRRRCLLLLVVVVVVPSWVALRLRPHQSMERTSSSSSSSKRSALRRRRRRCQETVRQIITTICNFSPMTRSHLRRNSQTTHSQQHLTTSSETETTAATSGTHTWEAFSTQRRHTTSTIRDQRNTRNTTHTPANTTTTHICTTTTQTPTRKKKPHSTPYHLAQTRTGPCG